MVRLALHGGCSSVVEHLIVVQGVAGSNPVFHPQRVAFKRGNPFVITHT